MTRPSLSKSTYIRSLQCVKSLYLHKKRPFLRDRISPEQRAKFERGTEVGLMAQRLFPGGIDCGLRSPSQYAKALDMTREAMESGAPAIYEAAFAAADVLIFLDILVRDGDAWKAIEVKSSRSLSRTYIEDAALQYHVLLEAGVRVSSMSLLHVDPSFIMPDPDMLAGDGWLKDYFVTVDVTETVRAMQTDVARNIAGALEALGSKSSPAVDVGTRCYLPYPCDFRGHCWKNVPTPGVMDLPFGTMEQKQEWIVRFGHDLEKLLNSGSLDTAQEAVLQQVMAGQGLRDQHGLAGILAIEGEPLFIDLLYSRPAFHRFSGMSPYQPIIFAAAAAWDGMERTEAAGDPATMRTDLAAFLATFPAGIRDIIVWDRLQAELLAACASWDPMPRIHVLDEFYGTSFFYPGKAKVEDIQDLAGGGPRSFSRTTDAHHFMMSHLGLAKGKWDPAELRSHAAANLRILQRLHADMRGG